MRAICYKCSYEWNYKGKQRGKSNMSCPKCSYRLRANKAIVGELHIQETLHDLPLKIHKKIHTYIHKKDKLHDFEEVEDGIFVEKKLVKQFKEAPDVVEEEIDTPGSSVEPIIKIKPWLPEIIRVIPYDPIKHI